MDIQTPRKNHASGHESHGVHVCHKCGWPFPNPHPSAKHRRSHRKICGDIEGYKLFNSAASDEEPLSEESHIIPFAGVPKVMESCDLVKNIGGVGATSNRSEDEVFSDAAMEFQDGCFRLGRQDSSADKDLTPNVSFKDCEDTCDVILIETEPLMDVQEECRKLGGGANLAECAVRQDVSEESRKVGGDDKVAKGSVRQETDTEENDIDNLKKNLSGTLILPGQHAGEITETVSMSEKIPDDTSGMVLNEVKVQLEEEVSGRSASKTSINESAEQDVDGNGNPAISLEENLMNVVESNSEVASVTSERTDDITSNTRLASKIFEDNENGDESTLNKLIDYLSPKAESAKDIGASLCTSQILPDAAQFTVSDTCFNSNEVYDKTEKEDEVKDRVSHERSVTFPSNQLNEDDKADTLCTRVAEDSYTLIGNNLAVVPEGIVEGKADVIQLDKGSDALGSFVDADTTSNKKGPEVCSLEEKQPVDIKDSKISWDNKEQGECAGEIMASAVESSGGNESNETSPYQLNNGSIHAPSDPEPTTQNSGAVDDIRTRESRVDISGTSTVSLQGEDDTCSIIPQLGATIGDVSKSSSLTDSLDGQWGSVSVLSTRSDNLPATDMENLPSTGSHQPPEPEKINIKKPTVVSGEQQFDKSDEFKPPSFMTLVEPRVSEQTAAVLHMVNELQGRKENEEIIAKVINWNAKQHTPLKSLLGEAVNETKPKSSNTKEPPREGKVAKDNGAMVTKVSSILGPESPDAEPTDVETVKEWNSPARYQADIKREKKKVKSRPLWAQFVCCSYVN